MFRSAKRRIFGGLIFIALAIGLFAVSFRLSDQLHQATTCQFDFSRSLGATAMANNAQLQEQLQSKVWLIEICAFGSLAASISLVISSRKF